MKTKTNILQWLLSLIAFFTSTVASAQSFPWAIMPGDYPDPTILRDDKDYYIKGICLLFSHLPTSHTTIRAVLHTAVPILGAIRDTPQTKWHTLLCADCHCRLLCPKLDYQPFANSSCEYCPIHKLDICLYRT